MKRFTLFVVMALFTISMATAQSVHPDKARVRIPANAKQLQNPIKKSSLMKKDGQRMMLKKNGLTQNNKMLKARRKVENSPIYDEPEGKKYEEIVSYEGYVLSFFGASYVDESAGVATIIEGTDGNIYISNLIPGYNSWVKAERGGGDTIVVKRQMIELSDYNGDPDEYYVAKMEQYTFEEDGEQYVDYREVEGDIKLLYRDGKLKTTDEYMGQEDGFPLYAIGNVNFYQGEYYGWYGIYWNMSFEEMTETITELPAGVTPETMVLKFDNGVLKDAQEVDVAFDGNTFYFHPYGDVDGWATGTIDGNKVTIASNQYVGIDSYYGTHTWLHTASTQLLYDEDYEEYYDEGTLKDNLVLTLDPETKTLTADKNDALFIDGAKDRIYYAAYYKNPVFFYFKEVPAVPADPEITAYYPFDEYYGSAELDFNIPTFDVDGEYITKNKLFYTLYVDDEVFELDADEYGIEESLTEIPYTIELGWVSNRAASFFFDPVKNAGIQTIYKGGDVVNKSNLIIYDIESETVISGVKKLTNPQAVAVKSEAYYDVAGREVKAGAKGFVIKTLTLEDGSKKSYKVVRK